MELAYEPRYEPATPAYVLAVLRDNHRQQCHFDCEADPGVDLTFDSTVAEWREACDLVASRPLGVAFNEVWEIDRPEAEWFAVLEPAGHRRLGEVCALIAAHATRPHVRPACLLGKECGSAGAFLTVRWLLHRAGASVAGLKPSSPLGPYARHYPGVFLGPIARLAPGALPPVTIRTPVHDRAISGIMLALLYILGGGIIGWALLWFFGALLFAASYATTWYAAKRLAPASVEFEGLDTFSELARALNSSRGESFATR